MPASASGLSPGNIHMRQCGQPTALRTVARISCLAVFAVFSTSASTKTANCLLEIDGVRYIEGWCEFTALGGGSFTILGGYYFASVTVTSPGVADGYWNEEPGANHAHSPLGKLRSQGACWTNARVKACAWKPGEPMTIPN